MGSSVAQTRVKKGKNRARDPEEREAVMSPPPARPFRVVAKPVSFKPLAPPPAHPFRAVAKPTAPMAPKASVQDVIELTSTSEGSRDVTAEVDTEYEDDSHGKKRKLKSGSSSRVSKKRVSAEVVIEPKKEGVRSKAKPSPSDASVLKGGPLSPLTVGSSSVGDEGLCYIRHLSLLTNHLIQFPSLFNLQLASGTVLPTHSRNPRVRSIYILVSTYC